MPVAARVFEDLEEIFLEVTAVLRSRGCDRISSRG
jgi:hypothetical protein